MGGEAVTSAGGGVDVDVAAVAPVCVGAVRGFCCEGLLNTNGSLNESGTIRLLCSTCRCLAIRSAMPQPVGRDDMADGGAVSDCRTAIGRCEDQAAVN